MVNHTNILTNAPSLSPSYKYETRSLHANAPSVYVSYTGSNSGSYCSDCSLQPTPFVSHTYRHTPTNIPVYNVQVHYMQNQPSIKIKVLLGILFVPVVLLVIVHCMKNSDRK